jgi:hypothetical protein
MLKKLFFSLVLLCSLHAFADGILISWSATNLDGMTKERFEVAQKWKTNEIIAKNLSVTSWPDAYLLLVASMQRKTDKALINGLIQQLGDKTSVKLQYTSRLIIWERIITGEILFEGKGMQIDDDLFSVAGRANFILRNITNNNFGLVDMTPTTEELTALQQKWTDYANAKFVEQYENPYDTDKEGLEEIRSLTAFEALIVSLKPSAEKETLTKNCLRKMYALDELPKEKGNPATYCSPDTYTMMYLVTLIGDKGYDDKSYEWWTKWWADNKSKLTWNKEKGHFELK